MSDQNDLQYDHEAVARDAIVRLLARYGYVVDSYQMTDKTDGDRVLTIKAGRNVNALQLSLPEAQ